MDLSGCSAAIAYDRELTAFATAEILYYVKEGSMVHQVRCTMSYADGTIDASAQNLEKFIVLYLCVDALIRKAL